MTATATLRHFNRTYTQRIGLLEESFLGLGMPLAAARLVFEIGPTGTTVRELRDRLGLDSGYLSRLLRTLQARGLVVVEPDPEHLRRRRVTLTPKGHSTYRRLDNRSERLAQEILQALSERQRRLTGASTTAELLVRAATVQLRRIDPRSALGYAGSRPVLRRLNRRFPNGFDAQAARAADTAAADDEAAVFVIASSDGLPVGCGGVQRVTATTGEIKRMWVDPRGGEPGLAPGCSATSKPSCPSRLPHRSARHQRQPYRCHRLVRTSRLPPHRRLQRQPLRSRYGSRKRLTIEPV